MEHETEHPNNLITYGISFSRELTSNEKDYLTVTHYYDKCLGRFIKKLPQNTILFIASDHAVSLTEDETYPPAVFMAVNVGQTERISRVVGQVNLYPATLDLLGLSFNNYHGMAASALNPCVDGTIDANGHKYGKANPSVIDSLKTAFRLSDLIIRSNYFEH